MVIIIRKLAKTTQKWRHHTTKAGFRRFGETLIAPVLEHTNNGPYCRLINGGLFSLTLPQYVHSYGIASPKHPPYIDCNHVRTQS